jgi:uncharacterized protein (TIGR03382 family)
MFRRAAFALVLGASALAEAHGPHPQVLSINYRQGHEQDIAAGTSFGLLLSHDGGATWQWMCELAIRYADNGSWNPDYAYTASGALFATTRDDALVMRDACSFAKIPNLPPSDVAQIALGSDGSLHMAAVVPAFMSNPGDANIYSSVDDGLAFPIAATAGQIGDWYSSLEVAPSDPTRLYLAAFHNVGLVREWQIWRSDDAGATYQSLPMTGIANGSANSAIVFVGAGRNAPDTVFAAVTEIAPDQPSSLYRSTDGGMSWTKVRDVAEKLSFVLRANGDAIVASPNLGAFVSHDLGASWIPLPGAPHINCLTETTAGEVWACTENYGSVVVPFTPSDDAGIMKSVDLATWTPVLRFQDITGPVDCPVGTRQHDQCVFGCTEDDYNTDPANCPNTTPQGWCSLRNLLVISSEVLDCGGPPVQLPPTIPPEPDDFGCCDTAGGGPTALLGGLALAGILARRRRR